MNFIENFKNYKKRKMTQITINQEKKDNSTFLKKIGLDGRPFTREELDDAIIDYLNKNKDSVNGYSLIINDDQLQDANFMARLYQTDIPSVISRFKPDKSLHSDHDLLIDYIRRYYNQDTKRYGLNLSSFKRLIEKFKDELQNPKFIDRLVKEFPDKPIIKIVNDIVIPYGTSVENENFKKLANQVSTEAMISQANTFGKDATKYIPNTRDDYKKILESSIENDGFRSLTLASPQYLLENKDLMQKAFNKPKEEIPPSLYLNPVKFFVVCNSPMQEKNYICHDDFHSYNYFSKAHLIFQYIIANDNDFWSNVNYPDEQKTDIVNQIKDNYNKYILDQSIITNPTNFSDKEM